MGKNFSKSDPAIFKFGIIRRANRLLNGGDFDKCVSTLCEGFDLTQVYMKYKPVEHRLWD